MIVGQIFIVDSKKLDHVFCNCDTYSCSRVSRDRWWQRQSFFLVRYSWCPYCRGYQIQGNCQRSWGCQKCMTVPSTIWLCDKILEHHFYLSLFTVPLTETWSNNMKINNNATNSYSVTYIKNFKTKYLRHFTHKFKEGVQGTNS